MFQQVEDIPLCTQIGHNLHTNARSWGKRQSHLLYLYRCCNLQDGELWKKKYVLWVSTEFSLFLKLDLTVTDTYLLSRSCGGLQTKNSGSWNKFNVTCQLSRPFPNTPCDSVRSGNMKCALQKKKKKKYQHKYIVHDLF